MSPTSTTATLGASFSWEYLEEGIDWLEEEARPLEVPLTPHVIDNDWPARIAKFRQLLDRVKGPLSVHGPGGVRVSTSDPEERNFVQCRFRAAIRLAGEIGATHMVVEPWLFSFSNATVIPSYMAHKVDEAVATLAPLLADAETNGVTLVLENVPEVSPELLINLAQRLDSQYARLCLDVGHAHLMHSHHGAPTPDVWVRSFGNLLAHVHLTDNDGEMDRHWSPGEGRICWREVFRAFGGLPKMPRLILEVVPERARRGQDYLSRLGVAA